MRFLSQLALVLMLLMLSLTTLGYARNVPLQKREPRHRHYGNAFPILLELIISFVSRLYQ